MKTTSTSSAAPKRNMTTATTSGSNKDDGSSQSLKKNGDTTEEQQQHDTIIVEQLLLQRSYHLPDYGYAKDWYQYMTNNHPIFGICCFHRLHPVGRCTRILSLIGSVLFGLAITNIIYLAFVFTNNNYEQEFITLQTNFTNSDTEASNIVYETTTGAISITSGNIALWTVGSFLHATFDNLIWSLAACTCCIKRLETKQQRLQRYRNTGVLLIVFLTIVITAICTFAVTLRAALEDDIQNNNKDNIHFSDSLNFTSTVTKLRNRDNSKQDDEQLMRNADSDSNDFEFIFAYLIELVLNYFLYYPIVGTILFTGILVCGKYPVLGGRPYELRQLELAEKEETDEEQGGLEVVLDDDDDDHGKGKHRTTKVVGVEQPLPQHKLSSNKTSNGKKKTNNNDTKGNNKAEKQTQTQKKSTTNKTNHRHHDTAGNKSGEAKKSSSKKQTSSGKDKKKKSSSSKP